MSKRTRLYMLRCEGAVNGGIISKVTGRRSSGTHEARLGQTHHLKTFMPRCKVALRET